MKTTCQHCNGTIRRFHEAWERLHVQAGWLSYVPAQFAGASRRCKNGHHQGYEMSSLMYQSDPKWACFCVKDALSLRSAVNVWCSFSPWTLSQISILGILGHFPLTNKKDEHRAETHRKFNGAQGGSTQEDFA